MIRKKIKGDNMKEYVKIPLERVAVIVGQDGEVKELIEKNRQQVLI